MGRDSHQGTTTDPKNVLTLPNGQRMENIPCSCQPSPASVTMRFAQRQNEVPATLYFPFDPGMSVNDLVDVTDLRTGRTRTFQAAEPVQGVFGRVNVPFSVTVTSLD